MGVKHFGDGSKIIVTSRDRQVLKNARAGDNIHKVEKLNEEDSLQLFSTFAFQQLNPVADLLHLSNEFVRYADGSPLALKITGSTLYSKPKEVWESEVHKLKQYAKPRISEILKISFDGLDELEKKVFLDIACFFKEESKKEVEQFLSALYDEGAVSGINRLLDKCLLDIEPYESVSMHDMLEEMGKDIVCQESNDLGKRSRLWIPKDVYQVLQYNQGTERIEGIKLDMSQIDNPHLYPSVFKNMINLTYIHFYFTSLPKLLANGIYIDLPNDLRCLRCEFYPFKSLPPSFNPKNLVVLKLTYGKMEQLWNEDDHMDLVNLRVIDVSYSCKLRKIPNLLGAINLKSLDCSSCTSLVELPCLNRLTSLETLNLFHCKNLRKIPDLLKAINLKSLNCSSCTSLVDLPCLNHCPSLETLNLSDCNSLKRISNLSGAINLKGIDCTWCTSLVEFPCLESCPSLETLNLSHCKSLKRIPNLLGAINLKGICCTYCTSLVEFPCLSHLTFLEDLSLSGCTKLKKLPELPINLSSLVISYSGIEEVPDSIELLLRLKSLDMSCSEVKNISSNISKLKSLQWLDVANCEGLKSLPELPPYLFCWEAEGCTSLERVEFANHNLYESDSLGDKRIFWSFSNCLGLNKDSIKNIETNAMLQIQYLAQRLVRDVISQRKSRFHGFICGFPGNEISAKEFEHRGTESRLNLKIAPNGRSGSRFLAFAICLVTNLTDLPFLNFNCKFLLTAASGEEFRSKSALSMLPRVRSSQESDHVYILFGENMIVKDNDYEEASFDLNIKVFFSEKNVKVKKCGVHVFYVDAESYVVSAPTK